MVDHDAEQQMQYDLTKQIQKLGSNFKKTPKERLTPSYIETRLEILQGFWNEYSANHKSLLTIPNEHRKLYPYFTNDDYDTCLNYYMDIKTKMRETLATTMPKANVSTYAADAEQPTVSTRLPPIQLKTFTGSYKDWLSFRDVFISMVHENPNLTKVNKCQYLKSSLGGDAENLVKQIQVSEANYDIMWDMLNKRYNNRRSIVNTYLSKLINQRKLNTESARGIRELLDCTTECLATLKSLNVPSDSWDDIVVYIVIQKLDSESHKQFEQRIESNDILPTWKDLSDFLEYRFRTLETVNNNCKLKDTKPTIKSFKTTIA